MGRHTLGLTWVRRLSDPVVVGANVEDRIRREHPDLYKSFSLTRLLVGMFGVMLPTFILAWDLAGAAVHHRPVALMSSLSSYYYHPRPLRDWFVGSLWGIGLGLMVYMGHRKQSTANVISWVAGCAALLAALFPTNVAGCEPDSWTSGLHAGLAGVLFAGLGLLCFGFWIDDSVRTDGNAGPWRRRWIHLGASLLIFGALVFVPTSCLAGLWPRHGILVAELFAVYGFAISWFVKGWELSAYSRLHPSDRTGA